MPTTNFPGGITSEGVFTMGVGGLLPYTGNYFFVNETTGSDGNVGTANAPFATLARAYSLCTAGNNDVVFLTGTAHVSATVAWAKNATHLIGLTAPSNNDRARISQTGSVLFTPLVKVTGEGCVFANFATFHGFATASAQVCWEEAGGRNYYNSVQFLGMGNATAAAQSGSRSLLISGADGENRFDNCGIGSSAVTRSGTNASLEFSNFTCRNTFNNAQFSCLTSSATSVHITVGASGMIDYALFNSPVFLNMIDHGSTTLNAAVTANAGAGGSILLNNVASLGATALATTGPVYVLGNIPVATTSGIAIAAT